MTAVAEKIEFPNTAIDAAGAEIAGDVTVSTEKTFRGATCLLLQRTREKMEREQTYAALPPFSVKPGFWDLSFALRGKLPSADSSYNGTVRLLVLDANGEQIERREVEILCGDKDWKASRHRIELDEKAAQAQFCFSIEKTYGEFAIDAVAAEYAGPSRQTVRAITFGSEAVGNMFLPGQPLVFTVGTRNKKPRPQEDRVVEVTVRDYWGAEYVSRTVELDQEYTDQKGRLIYAGTLDLSDQSFEEGRYYELHGSISEPELDEPTRDTSSFAIVKEAVTRQYEPFDIPFTASCWNPNQEGVFPLMDRLGLRVTNIYTRWSPEPPFELNDPPNVDQVIDLGMGAILTTPMAWVERNRPEWQVDHVHEALREGTKKLIREYQDKFPIALRVGNEPHPIDEDDCRRMIEGYKVIYEAAKEVKPDIIVTATSCGPEEWFFKNGYQDYHDVYIFHQYADAQVIHHDFRRYNELVEKYGKRKPVWSTELGLNSQGMSRAAVASQMYKLLTNFFACGGENASWFGIMWPDDEARLVGTNGDSFDVFNSKYCLYSPKLTAISEYHLVNAICIKTIVEQKTYPDGEVLTLFRDKEDRCLLVAWNNAERKPVRIPLPTGARVRLTRFDGALTDYVAADGHLSLALSPEAMLLQFESADYALPETLEESVVKPVSDWSGVVKGCQVELKLRADSPELADAMDMWIPPYWEKSKEVLGHDAVFTLTAPADSDVRVARLIALLGETVGELQLPLPVEDALELHFMPAVRTERGAGMQVQLRNRGVVPLDVDWQVGFPEQFPMSNGTFALKAPVPFQPEFVDPGQGSLTLQPGDETAIDVRIGNMDPITLYTTRLQWTCAGKIQSTQRYVGGCAGVPKVSGGVEFDGKMGDPNWKKAVVLDLDQPEQFAIVTRRTARWDGPQDLSATMHLMWDDDYLYIGMKVIDDVYCQNEEKRLIWRGDGLQFLLDPCRGGGEKPGKYDYLCALTKNGAEAWCHSSADAARAPANEVDDFKLKITPTGEQGNMIYELGIPWHRVSPFVPKVGGNIGLGMIVNNDDGQIRDSFMAWFGCAHSKQLDMNGDLILIDHQ